MKLRSVPIQNGRLWSRRVTKMEFISSQVFHVACFTLSFGFLHLSRVSPGLELPPFERFVYSLFWTPLCSSFQPFKLCHVPATPTQTNNHSCELKAHRPGFSAQLQQSFTLKPDWPFSLFRFLPTVNVSEPLIVRLIAYFVHEENSHPTSLESFIRSPN